MQVIKEVSEIMQAEMRFLCKHSVASTWLLGTICGTIWIERTFYVDTEI